MGTPVHAIQVESLFFLNKETKSSLEMPNVKLTYFNLRGRGEPCRIMLAYGGIKYEDERIPPPWDPATSWPTLKPNTPFGVLPILTWDGEEICQSMACARFVAREVGLYGKSSLEQAQVDEIVDVIQDLTLVTALGQLEKRLVSRGGEYFVGNSLTWADTHVFMYISDLEPAALEKFPKLTALKERVGNVPNIKAWVESRPKTDL